MDENKRYLAKYADLRSFAYNQIETLVKRQERTKRNSLTNNNMNVYKQLIEKERKQWQEERQRKDQVVDEAQAKVLQLTNQVKYLNEQVAELEADISLREECESKVNSYVEELVEKNKELQMKYDYVVSQNK